MDVDALILGGGVTGLWLRAVLAEHGRSVLLIEADALGAGQTIASQGIIHNGAKYAADRGDVHDIHELLGFLRAMPFAWRQRFAGENTPDLRSVVVTSPHTWYWNPDGHFPPELDEWWWSEQPADRSQPARPPVLAAAGAAVRLNDEPTISTASLLQALAAAADGDLLRVSAEDVDWKVSAPGVVESVTCTNGENGDTLTVRPRWVFLTAGAGSASLRRAVGLSGQESIQVRPLQMGLVRGPLPALWGHRFDERGVRLTITTQTDAAGRTVWQLGGRLAEGGHEQAVEAFLARAQQEVGAALPGIDLSGTEWSAYRAVRAEPRTADGRMPTSPAIWKDGNVFTLWPTKLALLPVLMIDVISALAPSAGASPPIDLPDWPRPELALPPWEILAEWVRYSPTSRNQ